MYRDENRFYFNLATGMCEYINRISDSTMPSPSNRLRILFDKEGNILPAKVDNSNVGKQLFYMDNEPCYLMKLEYEGNNELKSASFYRVIKIDYVDECLSLAWETSQNGRVFKSAYVREMNLVRFGKEFYIGDLDWFTEELSGENSEIKITPEILIRKYIQLHMKNKK